MSTSYNSKILDWDVKTIVISSESELSEGLTELLSSFTVNNNTKRIIGLDIESTFDPRALAPQHHPLLPGASSNRVELLKLSTGCCCLLIRLFKFAQAQLKFLAHFLALPDLSFASVKIKFCLELLERDYGLRIRNSVDLGQLAADFRKDNRLSYCGLADLAYAICVFTPSVKLPSVVLSYWAGQTLSKEQIESATTDAFVSFLVGNRLLGGFDPPKRSHCYYYDD